MTYLPPDTIIAEAKLNQYLLIPLPKNDKSKYLAQGGYVQENWQQLERDLREQILPLEAIPIEQTKFGQKYEIRGNLTRPNGVTLSIVTVWIVTPQATKFVTLVPNKQPN
ncbi:hypothetical protein PN462_05330 [Spirulina sp. CS-785/01]|uniref:DUF6883 domain-containing protein n=1 Tax=Spirulina sp. CS-785/01 TaxID=3021716 RepID=UPI00232BD36E|nr:DUF6883 domain-containing protein [Spirulina sp. CS-785/01]MDB9312519.1 hypothetical protein [Spirulina sp. CS-785/01]